MLSSIPVHAKLVYIFSSLMHRQLQSLGCVNYFKLIMKAWKLCICFSIYILIDTHNQNHLFYIHGASHRVQQVRTSVSLLC